MKRPRLLAAGLVCAGLALLATACGGVKNPEGWAGPAIDGPNVFFLSERDQLSGITLDGTNGTLDWQFPDESRPEHNELGFSELYDLLLDDGVLYYASYDGKMGAINASDGTVRWASADRRFDGGVLSGPVMHDGVLYFGTNEGRLYAFNASDGTPASSWPEDGLDFPEAIYAPPVVVGDALFVATMEGDLHKLSLEDGSELWDEPFEADGAIADLNLLGDGRLFVPTLGKTVHFVDPESGGEMSSFEAEDWVWSQAAFAEGVAYFGDFAGNVYAVNVADGSMRWTYDAGTKIKSSPVLEGDTLVITTRDPEVHFIDITSGQGLNRVPLEGVGTVRAPMRPNGEHPLLSTTEGHLFASDTAARSVPEVLIAGLSQ